MWQEGSVGNYGLSALLVLRQVLQSSWEWASTSPALTPSQKSTWWVYAAGDSVQLFKHSSPARGDWPMDRDSWQLQHSVASSPTLEQKRKERKQNNKRQKINLASEPLPQHWEASSRQPSTIRLLRILNIFRLSFETWAGMVQGCWLRVNYHRSPSRPSLKR